MWDSVKAFVLGVAAHARGAPAYSAAIFALGFVLAALLI